MENQNVGFWEYHAIQKSMDCLCPGLFDHMEQAEALPTDRTYPAIRVLMESTCDSTNVEYVCLARYKLWQLPAIWLEIHFDRLLDGLDLACWQDDYQYANLCAAFYHWPELLTRLVRRGLLQDSPQIRAEAEEIRQVLLPEGTRDYYNSTMDLIKPLLNTIRRQNGT